MQILQPETLLKFHHFGALKTSPKKTKVAVLKSQASVKDNTYHHQLFVGNETRLEKAVDLKENTQYIFVNEKEILIEMPQTKAEIKVTKDQESYFLYRYHLTQKTLKKEAMIPIKFSFIETISENEILISIRATPAGVSRITMDLKARKAYLKAQKKAALYEDINQLPYHYNGSGFITDKRTFLGIYKRSDNSITLLTDATLNVETIGYLPDQKTVYFSGKPFNDLGQPGSHLYSVDLKTKKISVLESTLTYSIHDIYMLGSTPVILASDRQTFGNNQSPDFYTVDGGLKKAWDADLSIGNVIGSDVRYLGSNKVITDDDQALFTVTEKDHSALYRFTLKEGPQKVKDFEGSLDGLVKVNDQWVGIAFDATSLQEVVSFDLESPYRYLTRKNAFLKNYQVYVPEPFMIDQGTHTVEGFVIKPQGTGPFPAILDIHGGPKTVYGDVYYHEMQVWASLGYLVFYCNPRGSDGKGDAFADLRGQYGQIDYDDFMAFTDAVLNAYPVDASRLYITGGSYGGFMTNWVIGHTNRFKAAVTQRSISNWLSFYGTSDIGFTFGVDQTGGHPLKDREKLWDQSPLKYALNIKTPLRFIHSDQDHRCPMEQAQQLYAVLKNEGIDTDLIWFKNENHELSRSGKPEARIKRLYSIQDWFKKYGGHA